MSLPTLATDEAFASRAGAPAGATWFAERQAAAWSRFRELPVPGRLHERWRFADTAFLQEIGGYSPSPLEGINDDAIIERSSWLTDIAGRLVFCDDNLAAPRLMDPELEARGVIFTTLVDAFARHPELLRQYLFAHSPELGSEKYESLHLALVRNGVFLHVPKGVEVSKPFVIHYWTRRDGSASFPHTLVSAGEQAAATVIELQGAIAADTRHLVVANAHVHAAKGARIRHDIVQNWNAQTHSFQLDTLSAQADSDLRNCIINVGSAHARQEVHSRIFGQGANVEMNSLSVPRGTQEIDQRTLQTHAAPGSRSDLLYKNALLEDGRTIFSGLIVVEKDAQRTDAYQKNNNLMLSETAEANSLPGLEINANDVRCTHGATTGRVDESELFYFLARGIPADKARELMVFGFFEEIIGRLGNEAVEDHVRGLLEGKLQAGKPEAGS